VKRPGVHATAPSVFASGSVEASRPGMIESSMLPPAKRPVREPQLALAATAAAKTSADPIRRFNVIPLDCSKRT
jgi:hypothetical protein